MSEKPRSLDAILASIHPELLFYIRIQLRNTEDNRRRIQQILGALGRQADIDPGAANSEYVRLRVYAESKRELIDTATDILELLRQNLISTDVRLDP